MTIICVCVQELNYFSNCHLNIQQKYGGCLVDFALLSNKQQLEAAKGVQKKQRLVHSTSAATLFLTS